MNLDEHHGITDDTIDDDQGVKIEAGNEHHGEHGISVACPADGNPCYVDFTDDEGWYHRRGAQPNILIHELVWAANDQVGRARSIFSREQVDSLSGDSPVGSRLHNFTAAVDHRGNEIVTFALSGIMANRVTRLPTLLDGLDSAMHETTSNIPTLPSTDDANNLWPNDTTPTWTGVALSNSNANFAIDANLYSDIEPDEMGTEDLDYLVLGVWLEVPNDIYGPAYGNQSMVGVLVRGGDPFDDTNLGNLTGSATYEGPAIGIYEERPVNGSIDDISIGSFVAAATLEADFAMRTVTAASITDFTENGESLGGWAVRQYSMSRIIPGGARDIHGNLEVSRDGGMNYQSASGDWTASFYGNGAVSTDRPTSVAGAFWTSVGSRAMAMANDNGFLGLTGAFGAHITESNP